MHRLLLTTLLLPLLGFSFTCSQPSTANLPKVELTYWRVFDDEDTLAPVIKRYTDLHPNISIVYRKFRYDEYEQALLNALAEDRGPDLFSIPNTWRGKFLNKLLPAPATLTVYNTVVDSGPQKRERAVQTRLSGPSTTSVARDFVDSVVHDAATENGIIGLPFSVDTLALYANSDLLARAGIPAPATSWEELLDHTKKLRVIGKDGDIQQAAIALGTAANIPRSADILLNLMLQNGAQLADLRGNVTLAETPQGGSSERPPASEALRFYSDFANRSKSTYTWNSDLPDAVELFREGRLAYLIGYAYTGADIAKAPKIRWTVSPLPHPQALAERGVRIALANTWLEVVSRKTTHPDWAWHFIQFITSAEQVGDYLQRTRKPTALRTLVEAQQRDPTLSPFALQSLVAQTWYRGVNGIEMERALMDAITAVVSGGVDPTQAITRTAQRIQQTVNVAY